MYQLFEQEYKKCEKSLFLVAIGYLHNTEDAKDCMQEAVLSALKSQDSLKNKKVFKTWLTRIVINKCKDHLKKQKYTETLTDTLQVFYDLPLEEIAMVDSICKLDPQCSIYLTLRFYHEMTYKEIAQTLNQPVSTVKYQTKKALSALKKELEGEVIHEDI